MLNANPEFANARNERARELICKLNADPEFVGARFERNSKQMRELHANLGFAKAHSERMREQMRRHNADPEFQARRVAGIAMPDDSGDPNAIPFEGQLDESNCLVARRLEPRCLKRRRVCSRNMGGGLRIFRS